MKYTFTLLALGLLTATVHATIIDVPADQPTIQAGIDVAASGDTVRLASGRYAGPGNRDLDFHGHNIVLTARYGSGSTVIDCEGTAADPHIALGLDNGEDSTAVIDGFTITNAYGIGFSGAVFCLHAAVTVQNCIIMNSYPGAIVASNYSPIMVVRNTEISGNLSTGIVFNQSGIIENCRVIDNEGQGIYGSGALTLTGTLVAGNLGFGVSNINGAPQSLIMTNCTVVDNEVGLWYEVEAPKAASDRQVEAVISRCVIAFNREQGVMVAMTDLPQFSCCNVYGNGLGDWEIDPYYTLDTTDCFSVDPQFCDSAGNNYHLGESSPCSPSGNVCGQLIGAYDVGCSCCAWVGDVNHDGLVNVVDVVTLVCYMFQGCPEPPCFEEVDIYRDLTINISDLTYLVAYLFLGGPPIPCP